jgi:MOSC domain-containing protein YiiM
MTENLPASGGVPGQTGRIIQISISDGGVPKRAIPNAQLLATGLVGDRQANRKVHGGPDRAVCLWSAEVIARLQEEGHPIVAGAAGENVTIAGLNWPDLGPGVVLRLGETLLQVTDYAVPCRKNMRWFADRRFSRISQRHYPGSSRLYGRVLVPGRIAVGDRVTLQGLEIGAADIRDIHG